MLKDMATMKKKAAATLPKTNNVCPKESLRKSIVHRCASLTDVEKTFLGALLLEGKEDALRSAERILNDDMLFSVPIIAAAAGGNDDLKAQEKEDKSINATTIAEGSSTQELE